MTSQDGPLEGLRVVDLTHMLAGPYTTMLLADMGADVIKVEPLRGDFIRTAGPTFGEGDERFGGYFHSVNRNKRSIAIDLRSDEGRQVLLDLVRRSDVLVENFRVGIMERLELGYETLRQVNPKLVYACIRGFGDPKTGESPYVDWPAYDVIAQAMGGFMSITGEPDGEPMKAGPGVGDIFAAVLLSTGILAAVRQADRSGQGQFVDVGMYDAILSLTERIVYQYSITGQDPERQGNAHPLFGPFGVFRTSDSWVAIAAPTDRDWGLLTEAMGRPELAEDPRFTTTTNRVRNEKDTHAVITEWTHGLTSAEVAGIIGGRIPVGPVQTISQIIKDPHVATRDMVVEVEHPGTDHKVAIAGTPIKFDRSEVGVRRRAPLLGEHTADVMGELGYGAEDVERLRQGDIIA
nr:CoA transferase [Qaidamihabitans albus]